MNQASRTDPREAGTAPPEPTTRWRLGIPFAVTHLGCGAVAAVGWSWAAAPGLHTSGPQLTVWGFCISTVALWHATFSVNSVCHVVGRRRFETPDTSRNNWVVAVLTLGEGWHNNHHRFARSARSGLGRWELDPTWLGVRVLARLGLARGLTPVPEPVPASARHPDRLDADR